MGSFYPQRDTELAEYLTNAAEVFSASPTVYGGTAGEATTFAAVVTAYVDALAVSKAPETRTKVTVTLKDTQKAAAIVALRNLAKKIQAIPTVTPAQKVAIGLPVRDSTPTPVPPPATAPLMDLRGIGSKMHVVRMLDEASPTRRARPVGAAGAEVYRYVGTGATPPPDDLEGWQFVGQYSRTQIEVDYPAADVGKTAYLKARWYNAKGQVGPLSAPITGTIAA